MQAVASGRGIRIMRPRRRAAVPPRRAASSLSLLLKVDDTALQNPLLQFNDRALSRPRCHSVPLQAIVL